MTFQESKDDCARSCSVTIDKEDGNQKKPTTSIDGQQKPGGADKADTAVQTVPDGGWGWVVVFGSFLSYCVLSGMIGSMGLLYVEVRDAVGYEVSELAWIGSINTGLMCLLAMVIGPLTHAISCRAMVISGGILCSAGYVFTYFSLSRIVIFIFLGFFPGVGFALVLTPSCLVINQYFDRRRNLAYGLAVSGSGFGVIILPLLLSYLLETFTLQNSLLFCAGIFSLFVVSGLVYIPRHTQGHKGKKISLKHILRNGVDKTLLRSPNFVLFCVANLALTAAYSSIIIFLPIKSSYENLSLTSSALVVTSFGIANTAGRMGQGLLIQRFPTITEKLYFISAVILLTFLLAMLFCNTLETIAMAATGLGLFSGPFTSTFPAILVDMLGADKLPHSLGLIYLAHGISNLLGPTTAGFLDDTFGDKNTAFYFAIGCQILAICILCPTFFCLENNKRTSGSKTTLEIAIYTIPDDRPVWPTAG